MAGDHVVVCGGGAQGAAVVRALRRRGAAVRVAGRDATKARAAFGGEVSFAHADLDCPATLVEALAGCAGAFVMLPIPPGFAVTRAPGLGLLDALARARPPRLVFSTGGFAVPALAASGYVQGNVAMAASVRAVGAPTLVLRPAIYLDILLWTDLTVACVVRACSPTRRCRQTAACRGPCTMIRASLLRSRSSRRRFRRESTTWSSTVRRRRSNSRTSSAGS